MVRILSLICLVFMLHLPVAAQECPGGMRIVAGLAAGGGMDGLARLVAQRYSARYGRTMIVENRVGAAGNIAAEHVARSAPADGCTIIIRGNEHNVNAIMYARAGYEPRDFAPIVRAVSGPAAIVAAANQPLKTMQAVIDYAKAHPGKLSYGTSGIGSANHVAMEMFLKSARLDMAHIPYKGAAQSITDVVAGTIPLAVGSVAAALPHINAGRLIPLAVTGPKRWPTLPNVPTLAELGYQDATFVYWMGFMLPAATPAPVRDKLNQEFRAVLVEPQVRETLLPQGYEVIGGTSQEFASFLQDDERSNRKLLQELKLKVE